MKTITTPALLAVCLLGAFISPLAGAAPGAAESPRAPVALVEAVSAAKAKVSFMDYVYAGQRLELGAAGRLELVYLNGCRREVIVGGRVTVGERASEVAGGTLVPSEISCGQPQMLLTGAMREAGAAVRRGSTIAGATDGDEHYAMVSGSRAHAGANAKGALKLWRPRTERPLFKRPPHATRGAVQMEVIADPDKAPVLVWTAIVDGDPIAYPAEAPALQAQRTYHVYMSGDDWSESAAFVVEPDAAAAEHPINRLVPLGL